MKKWLKGIILGLLFLAGVGFYGVYQFGGLKYYLKAVKEINQLEGEEKATAEDLFNGSPNENVNVYGGILMWVNTRKDGGVWVWGKKGPKYFKGDEYSVYSLFDVCRPVILEKYLNREEVKIGQDIYTDISKWAEMVRQGDYIVIIVTGEENGGTVGNLREGKVNNWWFFSPRYNIEAQCLKR